MSAGWVAAAMLCSMAVWSSAGAQDSGSTFHDARGDSTQRQQAPSRRWGSSAWFPRLRLDNDAYNFWIHPAHRTDEQYSNGVLASLEALHAPWWGRLLGGSNPGCGVDTATTGHCLTSHVFVGQNLYTPDLTRPPYANPDWESERPYAAWLFVGAGGRKVSRRRMRQVELAIGVTGRPALGETAQRIAHWLVRTYTMKAEGWETQVGFQPGVQLGWRESALAARLATGGKGWLDLAPFAGVTAGTIRTSADAGARLRVGYNLSHPWDPRASRGRGPLEVLATAGARGEYVARDFSLDGTLVNRDRFVERVSTVREFDVGVGIRFHRLRLDWGATTRSREYTTGPVRHVYSTMSAAWEFIP